MAHHTKDDRDAPDLKRAQWSVRHVNVSMLVYAASLPDPGPDHDLEPRMTPSLCIVYCSCGPGCGARLWARNIEAMVSLVVPQLTQRQRIPVI